MVGVLIARVGRFVTTVGRHAVPIGGVFGRDWHPATAIGVYWLESMLLALTAVGLCALMQRRVSRAAIADARRAHDRAGLRALEAQRAEVGAAGIRPQDVAVFHVGGLFIFGGFFTGVLVILIGNGHIKEPFRWDEFREGAEAMFVVVAAGFLFDLWGFPRMTVATVRGRVDACLVRWGLFWLVGFFGTGLMMLTGRPAIFFGLFAGLKVIFELWASMARLFGWRSLKDRAADATPRI
jgi:hypothetical protein